MDGLEVVLSNLPTVGAFGGFVALVAILLRALIRSDRRADDEAARYRRERDEHAATERELDEERDERRRVQDQLSEVRQEVRELRGEVRSLRAQIATEGAT